MFLHLDNGERLQLLLVNQMVHLGGQHGKAVAVHTYTNKIRNLDSGRYTLTSSQELRIRIRIQIRRIRMFLGLLDPDPSVRCTDPDPAPDPDPSIIKQKL